jgi:hypothetical protein
MHHQKARGMDANGSPPYASSGSDPSHTPFSQKYISVENKTSASARRNTNMASMSSESNTELATTSNQGLTLVHFSAQLERFVWDRGCA